MVPLWLKHRIWQRIAAVAFAYALALSGFAGALISPMQASEARLAAQLGVICTIHGLVGQGEPREGADPTPGKIACIEHCAAAGFLAMPSAPLQHVGTEKRLERLVTDIVARDIDPSFPQAAPPPGRGPPALI